VSRALSGLGNWIAAHWLGFDGDHDDGDGSNGATLPFLSLVSTRNLFTKTPHPFPSQPPDAMASRVVTTVLAGALPAPPRSPAAAAGGSKFVAWTKRPILHHSIRCGVARASRIRPHHPSSSPFTTEVAATILQTTSAEVLGSFNLHV
jgi:hypothetical protein